MLTGIESFAYHYPNVVVSRKANPRLYLEKL